MGWVMVYAFSVYLFVIIYHVDSFYVAMTCVNCALSVMFVPSYHIFQFSFYRHFYLLL